jgi:hypothetical protein
MKRPQLALVLTTILLAGCGGGGNGGSSTPAAPKSQPQSVTGSVVISIPNGTGSTSSSKVRYPQFVSPNAQSVAMNVNGGSDTIFNVGAGSSLCSTSTAGTRNCTLTFGAPVGSDTFGFLIFSGTNGTGSQLASATTTQTIAAGTPFNFTVAMNAAVGTMIINFTAVTNSGTMTCPDQSSGFNGITEGCAGSAPMTVTVEDPSGATITGTAPFAGPISVAGNDPSLSAAPNQITAPGQTVTLSYSGVPFTTMTNAAIVTLTAGGQTAQLSVPAEESNLYVANSNAAPGMTPTGGGNVVVYRYGVSGAAAKLRTLTGGLTNPVQPLLDSSGNLWVLDNGPYTTYSQPYINVYAPGATGGATPIKQITNFDAVDTNSACETMTFNPAQTELLVSCDDQTIHVLSISNFTATTTAAALQTVSLNDDSWGGPPVGMAFDNSGNLYVADPASSSIAQYVVATLPTSGIYQIIGSTHYMTGGFDQWPATVSPLALLVDNAGTLYSSIAYFNSTAGAPDASNEIALWNTTTIPCTNCTPTAGIGGTPFTIHAPVGLALDPEGELYVSNPFTDTIYVISRATLVAANGSIVNPPISRTINTGASPGAPNGMVVGP